MARLLLAGRRSSIGGLFLLLLLSGPFALGATVYTGVDTLTVNGGFDFSELVGVSRPVFADVSLTQVQDLNTITASPAGLAAYQGIRDMGAVPLDSLVTVPSDMQPDPESAVSDPQTGSVIYWYAPLLQGHLYIIWTREGHLAKVAIEQIFTFPSNYGEDQFPESVWESFIASVVIRWAYQDDGSHSLRTAISEESWGNLKQHRGEGLQWVR